MKKSPANQQPVESEQEAVKPEPTYQNVAYGDHERNVLDFWQAESARPTPLVMFVHSGGFSVGSKEIIKAHRLWDLLGAGISVASINYRLLSHAPLPTAHYDGRRALQFLRSKAEEWNIDKTLVGAFGGSAGAQICMWLAFHDEMANPNSSGPLERESTRLACVATSGGQTTKNIYLWHEWLPGYELPQKDFFSLFGATKKKEYVEKTTAVSALPLVSEGDPPIFMMYSMAPDDPIPTDQKQAHSWKIHHVIFGIKLKEKMNALGIEADLQYPGAHSIYESISHFLIKKLT